MGLIKTSTAPSAEMEQPSPPRRDFDREARGKTRCAIYCAALQSPVIQQYFYAKEADLEEIKKHLREFAEDGVRYTFGE